MWRELRIKGWIFFSARVEVGDVEVWVGEVGGPERVVLDGVVCDARFLQVGVLLPNHERASEQVHVRVGNRLLVQGGTRVAGLLDCAGSAATSRSVAPKQVSLWTFA